MTEGSTNGAELEEQVRLLAAGLGIEVTNPRAVVGEEILALAREGKRVQAIELLRTTTGVGLVAAKRIVDAVG